MEEQNNLKPDLVYEETPIMEPIEEPTKAAPPPAPKPRMYPKQNRFFGFFGNLLFVGILIGLGMWLSGKLSEYRQQKETEVIQQPKTTIAPPLLVLAPTGATPSGEITPTPNVPLVIPQNWVSYTLSGGVTYKLPPEMKEPKCDGGCISYGADMPGGTRFTISPRGKGQRLPDFRNAILTDASGKQFTMSLLTIGDKEVYEYVGDFTGSTIQGYSFSKIRGLLVSINDTNSVEFSHFSPNGKNADFTSDDKLLDLIVASVRP